MRNYMFIILLIFICITIIIFGARSNVIEIRQNNIDNMQYKKQLIECIRNANNSKEEKICIIEYEIKSKNKLINNLM